MTETFGGAPVYRWICPHKYAVPIEAPRDIGHVLDGGSEIVACLCLSCYERLPASWGCPDCEWFEERKLNDYVAQLRLGRPCPKHWRNV